ncbi:DUF1236 domain-containing protein [Methylobacterium sp. WL64]|uniref:DUF1236 domain-containing protein n=1 Tax=Methylobacterium sp. WL64 TaxID=2603894 RepID=UPI0011CB3A0C|nr:DUF1236 domain-containing protein [Methylobacterium sp. WL64]TXM99420.1 DUF1236 domain-containing protein [Methylobacterium sp. WL64]
MLRGDRHPARQRGIERVGRPCLAFISSVRIGTVLPEDGGIYGDMPSEFDLPSYNYTVVNDRPTLIDPRLRCAAGVID